MNQKSGSRRGICGFIVIALIVGGGWLLIRLMCGDIADGDSTAQRMMETPNFTVRVSSGEADSFENFAAAHGLTQADWPPELLQLREQNPETEEFVRWYPLKRGSGVEVDLIDCCHTDRVPLLLQFDPRWGYLEYGNSVIGYAGCGPTCLSMVCLYLLHDPRYTPAYLAEFSTQNGYCLPGNGTAWTLMSKGAEQLGMEVTELPLNRGRVFSNLRAGNPVVCVVGPGDFTASGHYLVLTSCENGLIRLNDPNSTSHSERLWSWEELAGQIRNLWAFRVKS